MSFFHNSSFLCFFYWYQVLASKQGLLHIQFFFLIVLNYYLSFLVCFILFEYYCNKKTTTTEPFKCVIFSIISLLVLVITKKILFVKIVEVSSISDLNIGVFLIDY